MGREPAEGVETHFGRDVVGIGAVAASHVWYDAWNSFLTSAASFTDFGQQTQNAAAARFGAGSPQHLTTAATMEAMGFWSYDLPQGFSTDRRTGVTTVRSQIGARRYAIYNAPATGDIKFRTRDCALVESCSWSPEISLGSTTDDVPSATELFIKAFVFFRVASDVFYQTIRDDTGDISAATSIGADTDAGPAVTRVANDLFVFYKKSGPGAQSLAFKILSPLTGALGPETLAPFTTSGSISATFHSDGLVYVAFRDSAGGLAFQSFDPAAGSWSAVTPGLAFASTGQVGLESYRGRLHVGALVAPDQLKVFSFDPAAPVVGGGVNPSRLVAVHTTASWVLLHTDGPDILPAFRDERLYLWHTVTGSDEVHVMWKNSE
jgi:hypothetical protein